MLIRRCISFISCVVFFLARWLSDRLGICKEKIVIGINIRVSFSITILFGKCFRYLAKMFYIKNFAENIAEKILENLVYVEN